VVGSVLDNSTQLYYPGTKMIQNYCNCDTISLLWQAMKVNALQPPGRVGKVGSPTVPSVCSASEGSNLLSACSLLFGDYQKSDNAQQ
jgi:hypothetical protein